MSKKIFLSPSNQTKNKYAYGNTNEAIECGKIAKACETALKRCGFDVKTEQYDTMQNRCKHSDSWGADLHIPIHTNAYNGKVAGTRIMCYALNTNGHKACKAVYKHLAPITPGTSENVTAHPELYENYAPKAPSVYIEVDFHDVPSVAKWLIENHTEIGEAICKGVCEHFGVKYIANGSKAETKPAENNTSKEYSLTQFVKDVQKACGATVDGVAGKETISKTVTLSARKNRTHAAVKAVQKRLYALGYEEVGKADGVAGQKFTVAVVEFQEDNRCWVDGEITAGCKTWKKLLGME